jgi:hypothetical protein
VLVTILLRRYESSVEDHLASRRHRLYSQGDYNRSFSLVGEQRGDSISDTSAVDQHLRGEQAALTRAFGLVDRWPQLHSILGFCLFEAAFYFAYRYAMPFSQGVRFALLVS